MQCAIRRANRLGPLAVGHWAIAKLRPFTAREIEWPPISASRPASRSCSSMMARASRIEGRLSNDVLCLLHA